MFLPCFMHVLYMTRFIHVDRIKIFTVFIHGIHKQKDYRLSVVQILTSKYQSPLDDGMQIDCTSDVQNVLEEVAFNGLWREEGKGTRTAESRNSDDRMKFIGTGRPVAVIIVLIFESLAFHIPLLNKFKQIEKTKFDD